MQLNYDEIAQAVYYRVETATGDSAMEIERDPSYAEDYDIEMPSKDCRDGHGVIADSLFNDDTFWSMARDWICDEIRDRKVPWDHPEFGMHYNGVCDALIRKAPFMASTIIGWKRVAT